MNNALRLKQFEVENGNAPVAIIGAGYVATGVIHVLSATPAVVPALVINRDVSKAVAAFQAQGIDADDIVVSNDIATLSAALASNRAAVSQDYSVIIDLPINVVIEATGAIDYGTRVILSMLDAGKDVISYNAEADALLGWTFHKRARENSVLYTIADGDQPGAMLRLKQEIEAMGFSTTALLNCKRHLNVHQNPESGSGYSARDTTSSHMTTAFGDGTKMQVEQAVVANITGMPPCQRGMCGVETTLEDAAVAISGVLPEGNYVDFTLAGDFGAGVGAMARHKDYALHKKAMTLYKMGQGPDYFFFRPYHLVHLELPNTLFDLLVHRSPLGIIDKPHTAEVIAIAKKNLIENEKMDCIGGFSAYGHIDSATGAEGFLPIGLAEFATLKAPVNMDDPIPLSAVKLDDSIEAVKLWQAQQREWKRNSVSLDILT